MAAPANTAATTAIDLGTLPAAAAQRVDDAGTTYTVWYKFTATTTGEIGVWGFGDLVTYIPTGTAWIGPATSPTAYLSIGGVNKPWQMPVTAGTEYFFKFTPNGGNPTPANLAISVLAAPANAIAAGQLFVPDDTDLFPAVRLAAAGGAVQGFVLDFPNGENGDVFAGGCVIAEDAAATVTALYSPKLEPIGTLPFHANAMIRINKTTNIAYLGNRGGGAVHATITTVLPSGVLGPTTWTLPAAGLSGGCVSPDGGVLYYSPAGVTPAVKQFDLANNAALSDLAAGVAGYAIADFLGLDDGSILVLYLKTAVVRDAFVRHYSIAGTVLATYVVGVTGQAATAPKLAYALNHPASFWVWTHDVSPSGFSRFQNIAVAGGAVLTVFTVSEFEAGVFQPAATATPARFGISFSCPFMVLRGTARERIPTLTPRTIDHEIRRVRRAPHLSDEQMWHFYDRFQLDIEAGNVREVDRPMFYDLQWSDDGGHTWSNLHRIQADWQGMYKFRALWRRLGRSRDRVFQVIDSNRGKTVLLDAYLQLRKGES